jgi:hypothetical protein
MPSSDMVRAHFSRFWSPEPVPRRAIAPWAGCGEDHRLCIGPETIAKEAVMRWIVVTVLLWGVAGVPRRSAAEEVNPCGCYHGADGNCICTKTKKLKCACAGDCEPVGCEAQRAKEANKAADAALKRIDAKEKRKAAEAAAAAKKNKGKKKPAAATAAQ